MNRIARFVLALPLALVSASAIAQAQDGKKIYQQRCAFCHGDTGKGDGPSGQALQPAPKDFSQPAFWASIGDGGVRKAIENGKPGTAMIGFKNIMKPEEIDAVASHVESFRPAK